MDSTERTPLGTTGLLMPRLIFGSSALGNLYEELDTDTKRSLVAEWMEAGEAPICIDSAGKYGAGLALEEIGRGLRAHGVPRERVIISNKLGWYRVPLAGDEPTFEPGAWINLTHDAKQTISYEGIINCRDQGDELLGAGYSADLLSVHDPDEYLLAATDPADRKRRFADVLDAYRGLIELRDSGKCLAVGIGSKDWHVIAEVVERVDLDWVMFAGSFTLYTHPSELLSFIRGLSNAGVFIINSAVFNAGFLVGGSYFDYRLVTPESHSGLFAWRDRFLSICREYEVNPAEACVEFGLAPKGVESVAMNTTRPERVRRNVQAVKSHAPGDFWATLRNEGIIRMTPAEMQS